MDCKEARTHLLDYHRGDLSTERERELALHLRECADCRRDEAAERELSAALDAHLPRPRAPASLRQSLEARIGVESTSPASLPSLPSPASRTRALRAWAFGASGSLAVAAALLIFLRSPAPDMMVREALNDHLRVLYSAHPVEVEGGGSHQVKPWFEGRVDFAPTVAFGGDDEFPLVGGSVAYFVDRKAAAYVYKRRAHVITLLVYRAEGLPWAGRPTVPLGRLKAAVQTTQGFHVLTWRDGDLGYSLVSDLNLTELETLGAKIPGA